jgi:hypothetical protein
MDMQCSEEMLIDLLDSFEKLENFCAARVCHACNVAFFVLRDSGSIHPTKHMLTLSLTRHDFECCRTVCFLRLNITISTKWWYLVQETSSC